MQSVAIGEILNGEGLDLLKSQLPFAYSSLRIESSHRPIGFRFSKHIINIIATLNEREIVVCGEADSRDLAKAKALSELIERSALILDGERYNSVNSNGWAAHSEINQARTNAILELVERDAALSQWYSSTPFLQIDNSSLPSEIQNWASTELLLSEFPKLILLLSTKGMGPSVTCILTNDSGVGVSAHCTRMSLNESILGAIAEACRAAHLAIRKEFWGDTLKLKNSIPGSVDPSAHAVYYAYHEAFPTWMFGETISSSQANSIWIDRIQKTLNDKSFDFHSVMALPIHVGFAKHFLAFDLKWERTDKNIIASSSGAKRLNLETETINEKPHIVS